MMRRAAARASRLPAGAEGRPVTEISPIRWFYRYRDAVEEGGVEALLEKTRRVPNRKNRVDLETENAVVDYAVQYPAHGQVRVSNELRKRGAFVSPSGVRSIWLRHDLAHFKLKLSDRV